MQVVETKEVNEDEEEGPILLTNVIDLSMSDGQQPQNDIDMKLPLHSSNSKEEMCVLATSEEDPEDEDDWEVLEARTDQQGKAAVFKISHFSM